jgi:hypothetical protein
MLKLAQFYLLLNDNFIYSLKTSIGHEKDEDDSPVISSVVSLLYWPLPSWKF